MSISPRQLFTWTDFNVHHVSGESPGTSESDHFMREAHVTHKPEEVGLNWERHPAPMSTGMLSEYRRFPNHLIVILCLSWLIVGFQTCHKLYSVKKILKHENPKNNATQMGAVPLLTQGTETGALSPFNLPSPVTQKHWSKHYLTLYTVWSNTRKTFEILFFSKPHRKD